MPCQRTTNVLDVSIGGDHVPAIVLDAIWQISLQLAPWLLLGAALSGALHIALPPDFLTRHLRGKLGVLKAVVLGVPLPLCSCGVIPAGLGLRRDGASSGASVGFLIATPQTGVDSIMVSASMLGWPFAMFKVAAALLTGLIGGIATDRWARAGGTLASQASEPNSGGRRRSLRQGVDHTVMVLRSIWGWLLLGILISALLDAWVPADAWATVARWNPNLSMLVALAIALPLYVCATASVPIAASLVAGGLPPGAALVFLMAGPATNLATIGAVNKGLGIRATGIYLATVIVGSIGLGASFNWLLVGGLPVVPHHHEQAGAVSIAGAVALWALIAWFALESGRASLSKLRGAPETGAEIDVRVSGMTCDGCVRRLQRVLDSDAEVSSSVVTLDPQRARVRGPIADQRLRRLVEQAGYQVVE